MFYLINLYHTYNGPEKDFILFGPMFLACMLGVITIAQMVYPEDDDRSTIKVFLLSFVRIFYRIFLPSTAAALVCPSIIAIAINLNLFYTFLASLDFILLLFIALFFGHIIFIIGYFPCTGYKFMYDKLSVKSNYIENIIKAW